MIGRPSAADALSEALRPMIVELIEEEVQRQLEARELPSDDPFLTTREYARLHKTTPEAVLARIHRKTLHATKPPGARAWLIPADEPYHPPTKKPSRRGNGRGHDTEKE